MSRSVTSKQSTDQRVGRARGRGEGGGGRRWGAWRARFTGIKIENSRFMGIKTDFFANLAQLSVCFNFSPMYTTDEVKVKNCLNWRLFSNRNFLFLFTF